FSSFNFFLFIFLFLFSIYLSLLSFPTRRSSDLRNIDRYPFFLICVYLCASVVSVVGKTPLLPLFPSVRKTGGNEGNGEQQKGRCNYKIENHRWTQINPVSSAAMSAGARSVLERCGSLYSYALQ